MLAETQVAELLAPFELHLTSAQISQVITYLDLLMRWNHRINLTAIGSAQEGVTRHFGESLFLSRLWRVEGRLLDVGSGAGFPGLALKIAFPSLAVTLLEPTAKKRAFLKEAARACSMDAVEVLAERLEVYAKATARPAFAAVTARAVGQFDSLVPAALQCMEERGRLCLWLTKEQASSLCDRFPQVSWQQLVPIPLARQRVILIGTLPG